jgi:tetratricopeptide (TPR) repeat protein
MDPEQEYWLLLAIKLCPQLQDAVNSLAHLYVDEKRFDEAIALVTKAMQDDPRNEGYHTMLDSVNVAKNFGRREDALRAQLAASPYDVGLNLDLAALLQDEGKFDELNDRMKTVAGLTNWSHEGMAGIVEYYVNEQHNPNAAIAFLQARAEIDPKAGELIYSLSALEASVGRRDEALKHLAQSIAISTNAAVSAKIDPRFAPLHGDPGFDSLMSPPTNLPASNAPATNAPTKGAPKPAKK